jgi:hypothetical protein
VASLCGPAKFHLLMGALALASGLYTGQSTKSFTLTTSFFTDPDTMTLHNIPNVGVFIGLFITWHILWSLLLNHICSRGGKDLAWFMALFPYFGIAMGVFIVLGSAVQDSI